jgi:hypothetical protein
MSEIELIVHLITKLYIVINAVRLGWLVKIEGNQIILTKKSNTLTDLDRNTPMLIQKLISDAW